MATASQRFGGCVDAEVRLEGDCLGPVVMDQDDEDLLLLVTFVATALQTTARGGNITEGSVVPQSRDLTPLLQSSNITVS